MTEGTQPQEVQENTKDSTEVREQPREVSESREELDRATHQPEEVVEREGDFQEAEKVETAFKEVVQAVEATADGGPETEDGVEAAQAAADGGPETEVRSAQEQGGGGEGETGSEAPAATEDRAVETSAPAESAGDNPPPPEAPDPVEPMFPAAGMGGEDLIPEDSIDISKTPSGAAQASEENLEPHAEVVPETAPEAEDAMPEGMWEFDGNQQTETSSVSDQIQAQEDLEEQSPGGGGAPGSGERGLEAELSEEIIQIAGDADPGLEVLPEDPVQDVPFSGETPDDPIPIGEAFEGGGAQDLKEMLAPYMKKLEPLSNPEGQQQTGDHSQVIGTPAGSGLDLPAAEDAGDGQGTEPALIPGIEAPIAAGSEFSAAEQQTLEAARNLQAALSAFSRQSSEDPARGELTRVESGGEADGDPFQNLELVQMMDKQGEVMQILANALKMFEEASNPLINNMRGADEDSGNSGDQTAASGSDLEEPFPTNLGNSTSAATQWRNVLDSTLYKIQEMEEAVKRNFNSGPDNSSEAEEESAADGSQLLTPEELAGLLGEAQQQLEMLVEQLPGQGAEDQSPSAQEEAAQDSSGRDWRDAASGLPGKDPEEVPPENDGNTSNQDGLSAVPAESSVQVSCSGTSDWQDDAEDNATEDPPAASADSSAQGSGSGGSGWQGSASDNDTDNPRQ